MTKHSLSTDSESYFTDSERSTKSIELSIDSKSNNESSCSSNSD